MRRTTETAPNLAVELSLLALLAVLWGSTYAFIKIGVATIPPVTLVAARTLIAGLLLWLIISLRHIALPRDGATWRRFLLQACLNTVVPSVLIAWAQLTVESSLATILNSTSPIFTFLFTWTITRHEPVTARKLFGVVAGLGGIILIVGVEALTGLGQMVLAQTALVVATIAYAWAAIFGRGFREHDPMVPATGSLLAGLVMLVPLSLIVDRPWTLAPSFESLAALLGLSVFSGALGVVIYFRLLNTLGSVGTTAQAYLRVPVGVAIGVVLLGEILAPTGWAGLLCVFIGVAVMTIPPRKKALATSV